MDKEIDLEALKATRRKERRAGIRRGDAELDALFTKGQPQDYEDMGIVDPVMQRSLDIPSNSVLTWNDVRRIKEAKRSKLLQMEEKQRNRLKGMWSYKNPYWRTAAIVFGLALLYMAWWVATMLVVPKL